MPTIENGKLNYRVSAVGDNDADNVFDSTLVVKNRDGSILERTEWIIDALGGPAIQVRAEKSISGTVEENSLQQFSIAIYDVDSGAVATGDIDITGISNVLMRSRAGGAFSSAGITQPTFAKGTGLVSCDYQFLAAEWQVGDMYKLNVKGITATVDGDTAYIPEMVWSNIVIEMEELQATVGQQGSAADYTASANDSNIMAFIKAVLGVQVIAEGTLTTDSATVPADTTLGAAKATGYYDGKLLMTLTGDVAFQPKLITSYAGTTGVFTLDAQHPFTNTPGTVAYVILSSDISLVPAADQTTNTIPAHVVGNKADTIPAMNAAPSANDSIVRHAKAIMERIGATPNDPDDSVLTNLGQRDDAATNDDMSDIATTSMEAKLRLILNRLSTDAFTANIQGSARTAIDTMLAQISAYFAAGGAVIASTVDPGGSSRVDLETILEDIGKILAGGGITTFPAGAAAANGVSMAAALRYASEEVDKIPKSDGAVTWNGTALQSIQDEAEDALEGEDLDHLLKLDDAAQNYPVNCANDSVIAKMLCKGATATPSTYDNVTDSQEMISDKIGAYSGDGGAAIDDSIKAELDLIEAQTDDIGALGAGLTDLGGMSTDMKAEVETECTEAIEADDLDHLMKLDDVGQPYPVNCAADSIIAKIIAKGDPATPSTYNCTTDSLEMLSDKAGAFSGDGGSDQDDSAKASLDLAHTDLDDIISALAGGVVASKRAIGRLQMAATTIELNQVAATYTLFTGTTQAVVLEKLVFRVPNVDISGGSLTSISIQTDDVTPAVIISSADGVLANLTHEASITWTGAILIPVGTLVRLTIAGGVSGVACSCDVVAECRAVVNLGYLA